MISKEQTKKALLVQCKKYPKLEPTDIFKFIFQSSFGCEHMVSGESDVIGYIKKELSESEMCGEALVEALDGDYSRVGLSYLKNGLSAEILGKLFIMSAKKEQDGEVKLKEKLEVAENMARDGLLPFSTNEFLTALSCWREKGCPAVHHSDTFRKAYHPSYRVISNSFVPFLPVFARLDTELKKGKVHVAIDGGAASGKSTFADILEKLYGCQVFHMDDFFLRPEQRTPERFAETGGNVDRERFLSEVLVPLKNTGKVNYRKLNCADFTLTEPITVKVGRLTVTEGSYSMHPDLAKYYDLSVFLEVSENLQRKRITARNSPFFAKRFFDEWIPMENRYFEGMNVKNRCDVAVYIG